MKYLIKYSPAQGQFDEVQIPWAFCDAAARILAGIEAKKKYPHNKGIIIESSQAIKADWMNEFNNMFDEKSSQQ